LASFDGPDFVGSGFDREPSTTCNVQVKNAGRARVPGATLYIHWPYQTSDGQHVLYLLQPPIIVSCCL